MYSFQIKFATEVGSSKYLLHISDSDSPACLGYLLLTSAESDGKEKLARALSSRIVLGSPSPTLFVDKEL